MELRMPSTCSLVFSKNGKFLHGTAMTLLIKIQLSSPKVPPHVLLFLAFCVFF